MAPVHSHLLGVSRSFVSNFSIVPVIMPSSLGYFMGLNTWVINLLRSCLWTGLFGGAWLCTGFYLLFQLFAVEIGQRAVWSLLGRNAS